MNTFLFWWLIAGAVSTLIMYIVSDTKPRTLLAQLIFVLWVVAGPIPILLALILTLAQAVTYSKLKKFASLTIIYFFKDRKYRLFLNDILVMEDLPFETFMKLVPYIRVMPNLTYLSTVADPVTNLGDLDVTEVEVVKD